MKYLKDFSQLNLLMFTRSMGLGGTENVVLQLCEILKPYVNKVVVCSCGGVNTEKLANIGITHYEIPDIEKKSIKTFFKAARALKRIVKKERINIIHTHHRMAAFYVRFLKLYKKRIFISTAHNTFTDKKLLTKYSYKRSNVIACGEMVRQNLISYYGLNEDKVVTIHNAVKAFDGNLSDDLMLKSYKDSGYTLVGNIGRLSEQKGMEYFIRSLPMVKEKVPLIKYFIVGDGDRREYLVELSNNLGLNDDICFLGYRTDIRNIMMQSDFLVLSSLWEGLPLTPIEAFSVKKTIIATAVDGTVEIVKDGVNGILIPPKDSGAIAENVIDLCKNPELRERLEKAAFETYQNDFSFDGYSERVLAFYKELCNPQV